MFAAIPQTFVLQIGLVAVAVAAALSLYHKSHGATHFMVPPTVTLEAGFGAERLSSSKAALVLRFILRCVHRLFFLHHEAILDVPHIEKMLSKNRDIFDVGAMTLTLLQRVFGCDFAGKEHARLLAMRARLTKLVARDALNESTVIAALNRASIGSKVSSLITFSDDPGLRQPWERLDDVRILEPTETGRLAELDLKSLLNGLIPCISIPLQYGAGFLGRNPSLLEDLNCFETQATVWLWMGLPTWFPLPSFRRGVAARDRVRKALESVFRYLQSPSDPTKGGGYGGDADVSDAILERLHVFEELSIPLDAIGQIEFALNWAEYENTRKILFWFIFYIYSVPGLLETLRHEVSASGAIALSDLETRSSDPGTTEHDSRDITSLDIATLTRECPLLKSSFFETARLMMETLMFRQIVNHDIVMDDGVHRHELRPGSWVTISNSWTRMDPELYPEPHSFIPERFIKKTTTAEGHVHTTANIRRLRPWGVGPSMCKGHTFAEKEILAIAACIVTLWDIEPVGGEWKRPESKQGISPTLAPVGRVRVVMKRREKW
ncbi:cytochrome P450 [Cercophora newfieldiana]|uniref:Cytochrome P450 n=1 Tax=Cercophora newfieldiana TaxID=92897 RepID=A0AA40CLT5_9PEZI|nr:cytochrome P450 [Cercophora newfieldiana]